MTRLFRISIGFIFCALFAFPLATSAQVATLDSMTCTNSYTDITPTDEFDPDERSSENYQVFWFYIQIGDECRLTLSFDDNPLMVFVSGGAMTEDSNWELDQETNTAEVTLTARPIQQIDSQVNNSFAEGETLTTVAFVWEPTDGSGPDENVQGAWVATDFQEYTLITNETRMGAQVSGDEGDSGLFTMYMPASAVGSMVENHSSYSADDFSIEDDIAVYLGDNESSTTEVAETEDSGAYLSFSATIATVDAVDDEDSSEQSAIASEDSGLEVRVTAGPRGQAVDSDGDAISENSLAMRNKKQRRVTLRWGAIDLADTYKVQMRSCKSNTKALCKNKSHYQKAKKYRKFTRITTNKKIVRSLVSQSFYQWRVSACITDSGCTDWTNWKRFKTK